MANYSKLNKDALIDLCHEKAIEITGQETNAQLVALLESADASPDTEDAPAPDIQETPPVMEETPPAEAPIQLSEENVFGHSTMVQKIQKEKKVSVMIPKEDGDTDNSTLPVFINGTQWNITKGKIVEVPKSIALIIQNMQNTDPLLEERKRKVQDI